MQIITDLDFYFLLLHLHLHFHLSRLSFHFYLSGRSGIDGNDLGSCISIANNRLRH